MGSHAIIIATKYSEKCNDIIENIVSITENYPNSIPIVIDNASEDKSYFDKIKTINQNLIIEDINNINYEVGAYDIGYRKYSNDFQYFTFIQDSFIIKKHIDVLHEIPKNTAIIFEGRQSGWHEHQPSFDWLNSQIDISETWSKKWDIVHYNCFATSKETFSRIIESDIYQRIKKADCKNGSCAWERAWSILFDRLEISKQYLDMSGLVIADFKIKIDPNIDYAYIKKWRQRQ